MKTIWEENFEIKSYESDNYGKLKLYALFNYLQETAGNHAEHLGWGYEDMLRKGYFWVLSRIKLEINKLPNWKDKVKVTTWPKGTERLFGLRDFSITNAKDEVLLIGTTGWLIVDSKVYKAQRVDPLISGIELPDKEPALALDFEKIKPFETILNQYERTVSHNELDVNNHVNNARYIEWLLDCYTLDYLLSNKLKTILVSYVGESKYGDTIRLILTQNPENLTEHCIEGFHTEKNTKVIQCIIVWQ